MISELEMLEVLASLGVHKCKLQASREDLQNKHPHRTELIDSMVESEQIILLVENGLRTAYDEIRASGRRNYDLELINLRLMTRVQALEKTNKELMNQVNL